MRFKFLYLIIGCSLFLSSCNPSVTYTDSKILTALNYQQKLRQIKSWHLNGQIFFLRNHEKKDKIGSIRYSCKKISPDNYTISFFTSPFFLQILQMKITFNKIEIFINKNYKKYLSNLQNRNDIKSFVKYSNIKNLTELLIGILPNSKSNINYNFNKFGTLNYLRTAFYEFFAPKYIFMDNKLIPKEIKIIIFNKKLKIIIENTFFKG